MIKNPRDYLHESQRAQDQHGTKGLHEWVEEAYAGIEKSMRVGGSYAMFSKDGAWIESRIPLPVSTYQAAERKLSLELVRRRFVMDGWARSSVEINPDAPNPILAVGAPREGIVIEVDGVGAISPEIMAGETVEDAIQRFQSLGAVYYCSPWEQVTIPPYKIARIVRCSPGAPPTTGSISRDGIGE